MLKTIEIIFLILLFLIGFAYFFYPIFIFLISFFTPRNVKKYDYLPTVSIVLAVYNEESCIRKKIENLLSLEYPKEKTEIIIGSDGSTDRTSDIIREYIPKGVKYVQFDQRRGKISVLNDLMAQVS